MRLEVKGLEVRRDKWIHTSFILKKNSLKLICVIIHFISFHGHEPSL